MMKGSQHEPALRRALARRCLSLALLAAGGCVQDTTIQNRVYLHPRDIETDRPLYVSVLFQEAVIDPDAHHPRPVSGPRAESELGTDSQELSELYGELVAERISGSGLFETIDVLPAGSHRRMSVWRIGTYLTLETYWNVTGEGGTRTVSVTSVGEMVRQPIGKVVWQSLVRSTTAASSPTQQLGLLVREAAEQHAASIVEALAAQE